MPEDGTKPKAGDSVGLVTEVARKRRQQARAKVLEAPPDFIGDVIDSEVAYGFHPRALPYQLADFIRFRSILEQEYRLKFKVPDVVPDLVEQLGSTPQAISKDAVGAWLFQSDSPKVGFVKGRLDMGKRRIVQIVHVYLDDESILVKVRGTTDAAELLIKDIAQYLWAAGEIEKPWEEIESDLQSKTYGTSTRVRLGFQPSQLLSSGLSRFMDGEVVAGAR